LITGTAYTDAVSGSAGIIRRGEGFQVSLTFVESQPPVQSCRHEFQPALLSGVEFLDISFRRFTDALVGLEFSPRGGCGQAQGGQQYQNVSFRQNNSPFVFDRQTLAGIRSDFGVQWKVLQIPYQKFHVFQKVCCSAGFRSKAIAPTVDKRASGG
jgi:hypothetical protein